MENRINEDDDALGAATQQLPVALLYHRTVTYGTVHTSYNGGALATFNLISISGILADENTGIEEMQDRKLATK